MMDREILVHVDLDGAPHLVGRLWAHTRKNKETATFQYDDTFWDKVAILHGLRRWWDRRGELPSLESAPEAVPAILNPSEFKRPG
jgi:hypothetical protein